MKERYLLRLGDHPGGAFSGKKKKGWSEPINLKKFKRIKIEQNFLVNKIKKVSHYA